MKNHEAPPANHILTGQTERIASVCPSVLVRVMAKVTVVATFILILAGALVTGNKAAMSDPTWPLFLGHILPKYWVGGLLYEDSHRIIASVVGVITLVLAISIQLKDPRRFMKKLGWAAFALVVAQALFGGLIIHSMRHPAISMIHATLAQAFFCLTIAIAVFSSRTWFRDMANAQVMRQPNRSYLSIMKISVAVVYIQVIMGAGVRHSNDSADMFLPFLLAHIAGAFAVIAIIIWFYLRTWHVYRDVLPLRRTALWAGSIVLFQIVFGILSIFANRARLQPEMAETFHVAVSTAHLLGGASLLALMFASTLRAYRLLDLSTVSPTPGRAYQSNEVHA